MLHLHHAKNGLGTLKYFTHGGRYGKGIVKIVRGSNKTVGEICTAENSAPIKIYYKIWEFSHQNDKRWLKPDKSVLH